MKFNKWTLGLAAVGVVSLASVAQADEKESSILTAVSSTTLSGYVSTSLHWDPGTGNAFVPRYAFNTPGKSDGFNLDVFELTLAKDLDESEWAAGYKIDMIYGPDANFFGTTPIGGLAATDFAIKQAYVALRTPIGNGIDWKVGVWDSVLGYESFNSANDPNYTRSYGYTLEPTTHTGVLGTYRVCDWFSTAAGIADTTGPIIGGEAINPTGIGGTQTPIGRAAPPKSESYKTYMGSVALTAPNDWSFLSGSSLYAGIINGWGGKTIATGDQINMYVGATVNTPVTGLRGGFSYDYLGRPEGQVYTTVGGPLAFPGTWANDVALYASYQCTDKLSVNGRAEYLWEDRTAGPIANGSSALAGGPPAIGQVFALTGTLQYDLWKNVISRLEIRWDHQADGGVPAYGGQQVLGAAGSSTLNAGTPVTPVAGKRNDYLIAANFIYKF
jgi:Putative beta-barrel porin-2, OmpL-like. bbp2